MVRLLSIEVFKPTNQNSVKVPKVLNQQIRKRYYKTLGTSKEKGTMFITLVSNE